MENFALQLTKDINKLVGTLKSNEDLKEALKRKLTKKEYKYYKLRIEEVSTEQMCEVLKCDLERLEEIRKQTLLKINQEKIKKELVDL